MAAGASAGASGTGANAGASSPRPDRTAPAIRTFLIADIRGYTTYTRERGDEAAAALAGRFAASVEETVADYDGDLLELRGDEALVVFDSARQAIRAAVALQTAFGASATNASPPVPVGVGLDAGEAVSVRGGFRGSALNMAARLCGLAAAGQVLATPEVVHLATRMDGVLFRDQGAVQLKGLADPVHVVAIEASDDAPPTARPGRLMPWRRRPAGSGAPANRRRRRAIALTVVGVVVVVLTGLAWGPWLPPPRSSTSGGASQAEAADPLLAAVLVNDEFASPVSGNYRHYMFPEGSLRPDEYPPLRLRNSRAFDYWDGNHGGVPVIYQTVRLVLEGAGEEPVLVTRVDPRVISRDPPLAGWYLVPEGGSKAGIRYVETNLDCPDPQAVVVGAGRASGRDTVSSLDLEVSSLDKEQLEISAYTTRSDIHWGVDITYVYGGEVTTLEVRDPRLHVTAESRALRAYVAEYVPGPLQRAPRFDPAPPHDMTVTARSIAALCER